MGGKVTNGVVDTRGKFTVSVSLSTTPVFTTFPIFTVIAVTPAVE